MAQLSQVMDVDSTEDVKCTQTMPSETQPNEAKDIQQSKEAEDANQWSPTMACTDDMVDVKPVSVDDVEILVTPEVSQKKVETKQGASGSPEKPTCVPCGNSNESAHHSLCLSLAVPVIRCACHNTWRTEEVACRQCSRSHSYCAGENQQGKMRMLLQQHWVLARNGPLRRAEA